MVVAEQKFKVEIDGKRAAENVVEFTKRSFWRRYSCRRGSRYLLYDYK